MIISPQKRLDLNNDEPYLLDWVESVLETKEPRSWVHQIARQSSFTPIPFVHELSGLPTDRLSQLERQVASTDTMQTSAEVNHARVLVAEAKLLSQLLYYEPLYRIAITKNIRRFKLAVAQEQKERANE